MEMIFTKRDGKYDDLTIVRDGGAVETIQCPKQGIIPHDMVHYAVESVLTHQGFLSLVKQGEALSFATGGEQSHEAIERLVETFQAEMWSGRVAAHEVIAMYEHACESRGHAPAPVSVADVGAVRERLDELTKAWGEVAVNGVLTLRL